MLETSDRTFEVLHAVRERVPLFIGLVGPSGSGKTYSALRLAKGMQKAVPGPIVGIDTENRRMLHYADSFDFEHIDFGAPFGSMDYLAAIEAATALSPSCIVVDSMSHEHEGVGGVLDSHGKALDAAVERAVERGDRRQEWQLREAYQMQAWIEPKAARRALLLGITRMNANIICCFRANEKTKPTKNDKGKMEMVEQGFTPIAAPEMVYEMTCCALLRAGARGVPTWESERPGEHMAIKLPGQFKNIFKPGKELDEDEGEALAKWAAGGAAPGKRAESFDAEALALVGDETAKKGTHALKAWWLTLEPKARKELAPLKDRKGGWKDIAEAVDNTPDNGNGEELKY